MKIMTEKAFYLYCICADDPDLELNYQGIKDFPLFSVKYKDIIAIISEIDDFIIDPVKGNVFSHEEVITKIFEQTTIIPMSFGNIFKSESDIIILLKKIYPQLKNLLPQFIGKTELGLKIFWNPEKIINQIANNYPHLKKQNKNNYMNQIKIGKEINMYIEKKRQQILQPILNKLIPLSISYKENKLLGDKMILNNAFLIDKENETKFDQKINEIYIEFQDTLKIKYNGPWPPYNFVNIKIQIK